MNMKTVLKYADSLSK